VSRHSLSAQGLFFVNQLIEFIDMCKITDQKPVVFYLRRANGAAENNYYNCL